MNTSNGSINDAGSGRRFALIISATALLLVVAACGDDPDEDTENGNHNGHADAGWVEIETRGAASELIAVWHEDDGWEDAEGNSITELPNPVDDDVEGLLPFVEQGARASLTVRFFQPDGTQIEMETVSRDDDTRERECSEYAVRYYPVDEEPDSICWGLMRHPESPNGNAQFVEIDGTPTAVFHCDHVHIYPSEAGTTEVEFVLWHGDHGDAVSDPLTIVVEESQ